MNDALISNRNRLDLTDAEQLEAHRELCKNSLKYLCRDVLGMADWDTCHDELEVKVREWDMNGKKFRLYLLPRGHLKTSIISIGKTIQDILNNFNTKILLASAVWGNSRSFLSEIKAHFERNHLLINSFGEFRPGDKSGLRWTQDEIIVNQRRLPNKTSSIDTAGIEKIMTSQHYDIIRADDLVTRENITTSDQIEKVKNYFKDLLKLLEPNGVIEIIGTRWHDGDVYGHIISHLCKEEMKDNGFVVYKRKAIEDNAPIFKKKFSIDMLANLREQLGSHEYSANYDNDPLSQSARVFKDPVRYWTDLGDDPVHAITLDFATSQKKGSCDAVVLDAAISKANQLCVVEYKVFEDIDKSPLSIIEKTFEYVLKYRPKTGTIKVGVEVNGGQEVYVKLFQEEMKKRNLFFQIVEIRQNVDKGVRIRALQPRWESGNLLLKQGMVELEEQMTRFPVSAKVDILDALASQLQVIDHQHITKGRVYIPPQYRRAA